MDIKPGSRWQSVVCGTEVIVVRASTAACSLECGGAPMQPFGAGRPDLAIDPSWSDGTQLGKRYADDSQRVEVLCTKAGAGSLGVNGDRLPVKVAKPLPASD